MAVGALVSAAIALFFALTGRSALLAVAAALLANLGILMLARNWPPA